MLARPTMSTAAVGQYRPCPLMGGDTLDGILRSVEDLIRADISLATSADRLLTALRRARPGATPSRDHLVRELARHPEAFRVLTHRRGPWHSPDRGPIADPFGPFGSTAAPVVIPLYPWSDSIERRPNDSRDLMLTSLCWLGAQLDENSPREIARWVRLAHSAARTLTQAGRLRPQADRNPSRANVAATHPSSAQTSVAPQPGPSELSSSSIASRSESWRPPRSKRPPGAT